MCASMGRYWRRDAAKRRVPRGSFDEFKPKGSRRDRSSPSSGTRPSASSRSPSSSRCPCRWRSTSSPTGLLVLAALVEQANPYGGYARRRYSYTHTSNDASRQQLVDADRWRSGDGRAGASVQEVAQPRDPRRHAVGLGWPSAARQAHESGAAPRYSRAARPSATAPMDASPKAMATHAAPVPAARLGVDDRLRQAEINQCVRPALLYYSSSTQRDECRGSSHEASQAYSPERHTIEEDGTFNAAVDDASNLDPAYREFARAAPAIAEPRGRDVRRAAVQSSRTGGHPSVVKNRAGVLTAPGNHRANYDTADRAVTPRATLGRRRRRRVAGHAAAPRRGAAPGRPLAPVPDAEEENRRKALPIVADLHAIDAALRWLRCSHRSTVRGEIGKTRPRPVDAAREESRARRVERPRTAAAPRSASSNINSDSSYRPQLNSKPETVERSPSTSSASTTSLLVTA